MAVFPIHDILILILDRVEAGVDDWAYKAFRTLTPESEFCVLCPHVAIFRLLGHMAKVRERLWFGLK